VHLILLERVASTSLIAHRSGVIAAKLIFLSPLSVTLTGVYLLGKYERQSAINGNRPALELDSSLSKAHASRRCTQILDPLQESASEEKN
jgi:hypothetical protein